MGELADSVHQRHVQKTEVLVDEKAISSHSSDQVHTPDSDDGSKEIPFEKSPAEKKLVRKISYTLMPFVSAIIFIQVIYMTPFYIELLLKTPRPHIFSLQTSPHLVLLPFLE
jgi:hypothetical protein